jgi:hypothetical protein
VWLVEHSVERKNLFPKDIFFHLSRTSHEMPILGGAPPARNFVVTTHSKKGVFVCTYLSKVELSLREIWI